MCTRDVGEDILMFSLLLVLLPMFSFERFPAALLYLPFTFFVFFLVPFFFVGAGSCTDSSCSASISVDGGDVSGILPTDSYLTSIAFSGLGFGIRSIKSISCFESPSCLERTSSYSSSAELISLMS